MKCDSCGKELTFLYFIGKSNVCNKCIAKHTVFKEVKISEDSFDDLKKITYAELEKLKLGKIKQKNKKTFKYKKNTGSAVRVGYGDYLDPQEELDMSD